MKCPKCSYTSFDYLQECKKCGEILEDSRKSLNLRMGVPTIFADLGNQNEVETDLDESDANSTFVETHDEQHGSGLLLGNEFSAAAENNYDTATEASLDLENELELGGLGSMDTIKARSESEFELDKKENIVLDDLELSPEFSDNNKPETLENEPLSLDDNNLNLFEESVTPDTQPVDQLEDDIALEFAMNDDEIDLNLTEPENVQNDGTIELDLDMDDDESLDDLLADLESKD